MEQTSAENFSQQSQTVYTYNQLTGLLFPNGFMETVRTFIPKTAPNTYCMVAIDILRFRLFNKSHGRDEGDKLLRRIAGCLEDVRKQHGGVTGYFQGDNFSIVMPWQMELVEQVRNSIMSTMDRLDGAIGEVGIVPVFGVAPIDDVEQQPEIFYDRATLALSHANARKNIAYYKPEMEDALEDEMQLSMEICNALIQDEFTFYAQPQYDIFTGKVVGAESLARWQHSSKGLISPGRFVPILERSGMIYLLDQIIWEKVCQWMRSWIDRGYQPVPISINISRIDILSMDVPEFLIRLLKKYDLSTKYIKAEITESAYAEEDDTIDKAVRRLREAGFLVMMDDFGSGYSSLNMLKSIAMDVIKIDMRFLELRAEEEQKGISILEAVVNMARLMGLPIIVEGVETLQQENMLRNMGCRYIQGYYYYKPLSIEQFEELLADERQVDFTGLHCKQVEAFHIREFMDGNLFTDTMLNNLLGPCVIYDISENQIEIIRVNEQAYLLVGFDAADNKDFSQKIWSNVRDDDRVLLMGLFERAYEVRPAVAEGYIHYLRVDGKVLWVHVRVFFLREKEDHRIYFVALEDMTALRERRKERARIEMSTVEVSDKDRTQLEQFYGNLPCGLGIAQIILDETGKPVNYDITYINRELERMCGRDIGRLHHLLMKAFKNDSEELLQKAYQAAFLGETITHYAYSSISSHYFQMSFYQHEYGYVACMLRNVTNMKLHGSAFNSLVQAYKEVYYLRLQDNYCQMIYPDEGKVTEQGNYEAMVERHFGTGRILKHDEANVRKFLSLDNLRTVLQTQNSVEYRYRRSFKDSPDEWCLTSVTINERKGGKPKSAIITIRSIDNLMKENEESRRGQMAETLASMSDAFLIYSALEGERILYANPALMELFGCQSMRELMDHVGSSFRGIVHPEDLNRVEWEIENQIRNSDDNMDFVRYRIIRKDGQIRWVDDWGHLETSKVGEEHRLFYVFIKDVTDTITTVQKNKILKSNQFYQNKDTSAQDQS